MGVTHRALKKNFMTPVTKPVGVVTNPNVHEDVARRKREPTTTGTEMLWDDHDLGFGFHNVELARNQLRNMTVAHRSGHHSTLSIESLLC